MKYPHIEKLGLKLWQNCTWEGSDGKGWLDTCIHAKDLESLLASAPVVKSMNSDCIQWIIGKSSHETHTALLIAVEPIKRGVTKHDILMTIKGRGSEALEKLADRIEAEGIIDG